LANGDIAVYHLLKKAKRLGPSSEIPTWGEYFAGERKGERKKRRKCKKNHIAGKVRVAKSGG